MFWNAIIRKRPALGTSMYENAIKHEKIVLTGVFRKGSGVRVQIFREGGGECKFKTESRVEKPDGN